MTKLRCIILEDEPLAAARLREFVLKRPDLALIGMFVDGTEALTFISENEIDVAFLDINVGGMSGIDLLEKRRSEFRVIITTAYQEYAVKGYELEVDDYLLKPFHYARFSLAVDRVIERLQQQVKSSILVKCENRVERVIIDDVLFIEGMDDYRRIHTRSRRIMTPTTFRELEEALVGTSVIRVHRSHMVNMNRMQSFDGNQIRIGEMVFAVSESYKEAVNLFLGKN
ncbi:MAG: LytR/AlgR family response regulator transcription factor [Flavobacteriales bacterium]|jgi:DNA-binding LytR/AlgR family response regulator